MTKKPQILNNETLLSKLLHLLIFSLTWASTNKIHNKVTDAYLRVHKLQSFYKEHLKQFNSKNILGK